MRKLLHQHTTRDNGLIPGRLHGSKSGKGPAKRTRKGNVAGDVADVVTGERLLYNIVSLP